MEKKGNCHCNKVRITPSVKFVGERHVVVGRSVLVKVIDESRSILQDPGPYQWSGRYPRKGVSRA